MTEGLSFLSRRWGSSPRKIRFELSYLDFARYLRIERRAMGEEATVSAYGTLAAIAEVVGKKGNASIKKFVKAVTPKDMGDESTSIASPNDIGVLRQRIREATARGEF